jgi:ribose transport system substrate-binding protein
MITLYKAFGIMRELGTGTFPARPGHILALAFVLCLFGSCEMPPRGATSPTAAVASTPDSALRDEEYVMVTTAVTMPMYVNHDQAAFRRWGQKMGVKVSVVGPADWDVPAQINTLEEVIGTHPTGLLVNGTDPALAQVINKAVAAGIPTVVYDSDIPQSNRHAFLGTDWHEIGRLQGEEMARLLQGKGKVAYMGILGLNNMEDGFRGMLDVFDRYPGIEVVGKYDDKANVEEAARITSDVLAAHPDIAGFCGFDSNSGPGIALAVREAGKAGKVKITTVDWEPEHLQLVKDGTIQMLAGQKRELFTWYGAQFLYDMAHHANHLSGNDVRAGITSVPYSINTGLLRITKENVEEFWKP